MKICVCIKYVPVISRITFDHETKTINRDGVPSEPNPFDMLGLNRALQIFSELNLPVDITALSMGPPDASNGIQQALALGATRGVLLSDQSFAGSDTLVTSRILHAFLVDEQFDLIITGRNSSDSETGQVGPQVAELLNIPHISDVNHFETSPSGHKLKVFKNSTNGTDVFECSTPCLLTVGEGVAEETWPSKEQMEYAKTLPITTLNGPDLKLSKESVGSMASPTWVEDIRIVESERRGIIIDTETQIDEACDEAIMHLTEALAEMPDNHEQSSFSTNLRFPNGDLSIWVVTESERDVLRAVSFELLGKAQQLSASLKSNITAITFSNENDNQYLELSKFGADSVINLDYESLGPVWSDATARFLAQQIEQHNPYAVLFPATPNGRDLASRICAHLQLGLTGDAIDLELDNTNQLVQLKPALGGNIIAPILSKTKPYMVTLREGMLTPVSRETFSNPEVIQIKPSDIPSSAITVIESREDEETGAIQQTNPTLCLGIGMGIGSQDNVSKIIEIANSLNASLATSRNVVHEGWLPYKFQVGISGTTISPKIYIAIGLRGAFNHTVGVQKSGIIIGVNTNKRHPIFKSCDIGLVGDWEQIVPVLATKLKPIIQGLETSQNHKKP